MGTELQKCHCFHIILTAFSEFQASINCIVFLVYWENGISCYPYLSFILKYVIIIGGLYFKWMLLHIVLPEKLASQYAVPKLPGSPLLARADGAHAIHFPSCVWQQASPACMRLHSCFGALVCKMLAIYLLRIYSERLQYSSPNLATTLPHPSPCTWQWCQCTKGYSVALSHCTSCSWLPNQIPK